MAIPKGYAQHLAREPDLPAPWRPMLAAVDRASTRMQRLIEDLIAVSELTLGTLVLAAFPVDLALLARRISASVGPGLTAHRLRVEAEGEAVVLADPQRIEKVVQRLGFAVATAANGEEGLAQLERVRPALILLDMKMPVMDGWQFVRVLDGRGPRPPIVVLTAAGSRRPRRRGQGRGLARQAVRLRGSREDRRPPDAVRTPARGPPGVPNLEAVVRASCQLAAFRAARALRHGA